MVFPQSTFIPFLDANPQILLSLWGLKLCRGSTHFFDSVWCLISLLSNV
jgi:hypothetical protein